MYTQMILVYPEPQVFEGVVAVVVPAAICSVVGTSNKERFPFERAGRAAAVRVADAAVSYLIGKLLESLFFRCEVANCYPGSGVLVTASAP